MKIFSRFITVLFLTFFLTAYGASTNKVGAAEDSHEIHQHGQEERNHEENRSEQPNYDDHDEHGHKEPDSYGSHDDHRWQKEDDGHENHDDHKGHDDHGAEGDSHSSHDDHGEEGSINLDEEAQSMIQLKTEEVQKRKLGGKLKVYGKIAQDTENYSYVTFDGDGRVKEIHVGLGALVDKGDPLISIVKDDGTIEQIVSDLHGAVLSIFAKPRERIDRLTSLLSIVDIDTMRATVDIYEKDLRHIQVGQKVLLTTSAFPDKQFEGKVVYISPKVDEHTQSIKVRVDVDNSAHLLRLGMFVSGELIYATDKTALAVPVAAIQQLNGEDIVFVAAEGNSFELNEIILGQKSDGYVEIKKGLRDGERVVTQGSFYLKSEQAKEAFGDGHNH